MVQIYSIGIFKLPPNKIHNATMLCKEFYLPGFGYFHKSGIKEALVFFMRTISEQNNLSTRETIIYQRYHCHVYIPKNGLGCCVITDEEYPQRVAFVLSINIISSFLKKYQMKWIDMNENQITDFNEMRESIINYQDPEKADKIYNINKQIDSTMNVMRKNIDKVLDRGVKIEELVKKSKDLSHSSKQFYKTSKNLNRCCIIV